MLKSKGSKIGGKAISVIRGCNGLDWIRVIGWQIAKDSSGRAFAVELAMIQILWKRADNGVAIRFSYGASQPMNCSSRFPPLSRIIWRENVPPIYGLLEQDSLVNSNFSRSSENKFNRDCSITSINLK